MGNATVFSVCLSQKAGHVN